MTSPARIPVTILTGFLGAGKTTLLNRLLREPGAGRIAVVINEYGDIGLDHDLVEASADDITLLSGGCLCCRVRGDLVRALRDLSFRVARGALAPFDRLVIETSGLADPAPVLQTLMTDPILVERYRLDALITLVDAELGAASLDRHPEALAQALLADRILLTKLDRAAPAAVAVLTLRLQGLNPSARIDPTAADTTLVPLVFGAGLRAAPGPAAGAAGSAPLDPRGWLNAAGFDQIQSAAPHTLLTGIAAALAESPRHEAGIGSACLTFDHPLPAAAVLSLLDRLIARFGPDLLRVKGLIAVEGMDGPVVIHGVQHVFHPPVPLPVWPGPDHRGRIIAIGRGLTTAALAEALAADAPVVERW